MDGLVFANLNWAVVYLTQTSVGILGNFALFCLYNFSLFTAPVLGLIDAILIQLFLANILVLLSKGIPQTMAAFGLKDFLDAAGCKLVFSLHRVARGVTLSSTCLLSCFQAIKISSIFSGLMKRKLKSPRYLGFCCFLCWILSVLINIYTMLNVTGQKNNRNMSVANMYSYCYAPVAKGLIFTLLAAMYFLTDSTFLSLMFWASSSVVLLLYRHRQRVRHIHSRSVSPRASHEARASCTVLILVSMFISFYALAGVLSLWVTQTLSPSPWLMSTSMLLSLGFPTFSPFVVLFSDSHVFQLCVLSWTKSTNIPHLFSRF